MACVGWEHLNGIIVSKDFSKLVFILVLIFVDCCRKVECFRLGFQINVTLLHQNWEQYRKAHSKFPLAWVQWYVIQYWYITFTITLVLNVYQLLKYVSFSGPVQVSDPVYVSKQIKHKIYLMDIASCWSKCVCGFHK